MIELDAPERHRGTRSAVPAVLAGVGERFPDLGGAASTAYYAATNDGCSRNIFRPLTGLRDSQDRSLGRGEEHAHPRVGQRQRRARVRHRHLTANGPPGRPRIRARCAARLRRPMCGPFRSVTRASTRSTRWAPSSTSPRPKRPIAEMARVLKPGGRAIIGVPNRHDPFLRPALAAAASGDGPLRLRAGEIVLAARAARDDRARRPDRRGRNGHSFHPRVVADPRPRLPCVVPATGDC